MNVVRPVSAGMWLVERGLDQVIGVVVELRSDLFAVHADGVRSAGFTSCGDAIRHASGGALTGAHVLL